MNKSTSFSFKTRMYKAFRVPESIAQAKTLCDDKAELFICFNVVALKPYFKAFHSKKRSKNSSRKAI